MNTDKIIKVIDKVIIKIESYLDNALEFITKFTDAFFNLIKYIGIIFDKFSSTVMYFVESIYSKFGVIIRSLSMPWGYGIIYGHIYYLKRLVTRYPLLRPGIQMVRAKVGGGKSLTSFVIASLVLKRTGHPSYMTAAVEKPKLSEDGKYWYVLHPVVSLDDYYSKGKKHKRFNTKKYKNFHKDENHLRHNPRLNKTKEYNEKYIPEHQDELVMRHQGFQTITKYSQHPKLDIQDMETIDLMHEVETIKDIRIKDWIDSGKYNYVPVKLRFQSYFINTDFEGKISRTLFKEWELPVPYEVLLDFETYAEKNRDSHLPLDFN